MRRADDAAAPGMVPTMHTTSVTLEFVDLSGFTAPAEIHRGREASVPRLMRRLILASNAVFVVPNSLPCAACEHPAATEHEPVNSHGPSQKRWCSTT